MKRLYNTGVIAVLLISLLATAGCGKSFLEAKPYSFITTDNYYTTKDEIEAALTGCYSALNANSPNGRMFGEEMLMILNTGNDECITRDGLVNDMAAFGIAANTGSDNTLKQTWFALYTGVNRCNHLLAKMGNVAIDSARRRAIRGEALFLRAFHHLTLTWMFGAIPINTTPDPDPYQSRQPLNEVYESIISDLSTAYEILPHRAGLQGRANKWTAAGYLAKVYAYLGAAKMNNVGADLNFPLNSFSWVDADAMYADLLTLTTALVNESGYKLTERYDYLFRETTRQWQYEECLFTVEGTASATNGGYLRLNQAWLPQGNVNTRGGGNSKWFVPTAELYRKYEPGDIRRNHNITGNIPANNNAVVEVIEGVRYYAPNSANLNQSSHGIGKYRYRDPAFKEISAFLSDGALALLRYADILLLHAEALYFNGDEPGAREMFTEVRERALMGSTTTIEELNDAYRKSDFVEELLDERSRELCFETGVRRFDLIRFGKHTEAIDDLSPTGSYYNTRVVNSLKSNWEPYRIWFPINSAEIDLNKNLVQNPGY